jgi:hypothetical protein
MSEYKDYGYKSVEPSSGDTAQVLARFLKVWFDSFRESNRSAISVVGAVISSDDSPATVIASPASMHRRAVSLLPNAVIPRIRSN